MVHQATSSVSAGGKSYDNLITYVTRRASSRVGADIWKHHNRWGRTVRLAISGHPPPIRVKTISKQSVRPSGAYVLSRETLSYCRCIYTVVLPLYLHCRAAAVFTLSCCRCIYTVVLPLYLHCRTAAVFTLSYCRCIYTVVLPLYLHCRAAAIFTLSCCRCIYTVVLPLYIHCRAAAVLTLSCCHGILAQK